MSNDKRRHHDDVAGVSDVNDRRGSKLNRLSIRANEVTVIQNDDDRDDRKDHRRGFSWI